MDLCRSNTIKDMQTKKLTKKTNKNFPCKLAMPNGVSCLNMVALIPNANNIIPTFTMLTAKKNCNIINSRILDLGEYLSFSALISGKWNLITKLEIAINKLIAKNPDSNIYIKRTDHSTYQQSLIAPGLNYLVQATTINKPELLSKLLNFFYIEGILIKEINLDNIKPEINLINLVIKIKVPTEQNILALREKFLTYCEALNLDTGLEPLGN